MTMVKMIEPQQWNEFLNDFSERNRGRRARYELFSHGNVFEEDEEAHFESVSLNKNNITIKRTHNNRGGEESSLEDELQNIRGISVQYDTDKSENMLEFTNERNEMTALRLESRVDGAS